MDDLALLAGMPSPETVRAAEAYLDTLPQVDLCTEMLVHGQMAARWVSIPAGTHLTGALTLCDNLCVVVGDITVTTDAGPRRLTGFNVLAANAGAKRYGVAHADTVWLTVHHTRHTALADIEAEMTPEADRLQTRRQALERNACEVLA